MHDASYIVAVLFFQAPAASPLSRRAVSKQVIQKLRSERN